MNFFQSGKFRWQSSQTNVIVNTRTLVMTSGITFVSLNLHLSAFRSIIISKHHRFHHHQCLQFLRHHSHHQYYLKKYIFLFFSIIFLSPYMLLFSIQQIQESNLYDLFCWVFLISSFKFQGRLVTEETIIENCRYISQKKVLFVFGTSLHQALIWPSLAWKN